MIYCLRELRSMVPYGVLSVERLNILTKFKLLKVLNVFSLCSRFDFYKFPKHFKSKITFKHLNSEIEFELLTLKRQCTFSRRFQKHNP